ncbi:right-handed parallel beta-helix repeat-containing protein, partial [Candidatus Poribacteria bacterium]|nr:right-handed parallel beta-helix repeat-containing protein [Candidatus Poribacteria bacterium]
DNTGTGIACVVNAGVFIRNCVISKNGLRGVNCNSFSGMDISNSHITENSGGGLICQDYAGITIKNSIIDKNTAEEGGGIFCSPTSRLFATDCVIANNTAWENGGGIWDLTRFGNAVVKYCTITKNSAGNRGGGIYVNDRGQLRMTNSIVWDNTSDRTHAEVFAGGIVSIKSCDIKNGLMGIDPNGKQRFLTYQDNIDEDPLFVNADAGDFTLQENSPAEGMGVRNEAGQVEDEQEVVEQEQNGQEQEKEDPLSVSQHGKRWVRWADLKRR